MSQLINLEAPKSILGIFSNRVNNKYLQGLKLFTDTKVPIYRGCPNGGAGGCNCPGTCREVIGYRDRQPSEKLIK